MSGPSSIAVLSTPTIVGNGGGKIVCCHFTVVIGEIVRAELMVTAVEALLFSVSLAVTE